jgi:quinol monooxygenase YgiN
MPEITVIATIHPKPGHADALIGEMQANVANVHDEPGCLHYTYHRGIDDPEAIVVIERWASEEALMAHAAAPHMMEFSARAQVHRASPADVVRYVMVPIEGDPAKSHF